MKNLINLIEAGFFILLSLPIALLPHRFALKAGEILGLIVFYIWRSRRKIAIENIEKSAEHSRSECSARMVAKETFRNLGKSFAEVIKIYYGFGKGIINNIEIRGVENYHRAKSKNKGVIIITGHCGNWELMALAFGFRIDNVSGVARMQNNPYLNMLVEKIRAKYGNNVIYKKGALKSILLELRKNKGVGILIDQATLKDEGLIINFLGRPAWTTKMPALIARKTGAPVLPIFIHRDNREVDRHIISIYPEIALSAEDDIDKAIIEDTKRFSEFIENYIKEHPSEWLWIHRRWKRT